MKKIFLTIILVMFALSASSGGAFAATAKAIDAEVDSTIKLFEDVKGSKDILKTAQGILVFPCVIKAGIGIGGEYGEGALRIKGKTAGYYNTAAASIGFQLGGQKKSIIIAFMKKDALEKFQKSSGWKIGADASVAVIAIGANGAIDSASCNEPIVAFVFDQKGLMYNLTLEGAKISEIKPR